MPQAIHHVTKPKVEHNLHRNKAKWRVRQKERVIEEEGVRQRTGV